MNALETSNTKKDVNGSGSSTKVDVENYLFNICNATKRFIQVNSEDDDIHMDVENNENDETMKDDDQYSNSLDEYVDIIAENLLKACNPVVFARGVSNLPPMDTFKVYECSESEDDNIVTGDTTFFYEYRRSDYLRRLLRIMAPISMEVTANICSMVISVNKRSDSSSNFNQDQQHKLAFVVLISHWLPVAPHLKPMVTEVFASIENPWRDVIPENGDIDAKIQEQTFVVAEALYQLCSFFKISGEISTLRYLRWDWTFVFSILHDAGDTIMDNSFLAADNPSSGNGISSFLPIALNWYSARILTMLMGCNSSITRTVLKSQNVEVDRVPWQIHPWEFDQEEVDIEKAFFQRQVFLWNNSSVLKLPSSGDVQTELRTSPFLSKVGCGITMYKHGTLQGRPERNVHHNSDGDDVRAKQIESSPEIGNLVLTTTTCRNLSLLGAAICQDPQPPPILVCGPHGSGKSSLIREFLRLCRPNESLIEFHIDEETDSKTLIGSYTTTDIPGEFSWRAGALTNASREGRWVLIEDLDSVPVEIQASLAKLFEERMIPLGNGKYERSHPNFRIFATCTTNVSISLIGGQARHSLRIGNNRGGGKYILNPSYWRNIHVKPMPYSELKEVAVSLYPDVPTSLVNSAMSLLQALDRSGREYTVYDKDNSYKVKDTDNVETNSSIVAKIWTGGRIPSVRDLFKLLSRISNGMCFEKNTIYTTEAQRTMCMAESVDIFMGSCSDQQVREEFIDLVAAPEWGISRDLAFKYIMDRKPTVLVGTIFFEIGRAKFDITKSIGHCQESSTTFAQTRHALRLMESIAICVRENEPVLLVGETGTGKTTNIQQLAVLCERTLVVQNLSLQTDSTDLLGGYRPLEIQNVARNVYKDFVDTFVSSFSRKQNLKFLQYAYSMLKKSNWKKLSQSFKKAAELGLKKIKERREKKDIQLSDSTIETWQFFAEKAERFERQRVSCDAGLAFEFAEGALVDAIQTGKWVLLDEINLASSDTLQRLCGLLDEPTGSLTLTERGDDTAIKRHPNFRLFAAMNPATDSGKKDLPSSIRCRFSELYVHELLDPIELRLVAARYLDGVLPITGNSPEHTDFVICVVDQYLRCRELAVTTLSDGNGHKPRYTLRTLSRALNAARNLVLQQRIPLRRAIFEGFQLSFEGILDIGSIKVMRKSLTKSFLNEEAKKIDLDHPGRRPGGKDSQNIYVNIKPFWIKAGPLEIVDWSEIGVDGKSKFVLTPTASTDVRRLARALVTGPWPILLEGPTSSGKTTLVEYIAARCGYHVVRINNHEHTDVQEYTGSFAADQNGSLSFRDGILVQALRRGHWVILDELNLAPSEVLEALNRLLDDNRELYLAETNETVKPHPNFRIFATQNPSGAYGGRKPLSRAFRNRFVELYVGDIPSEELSMILEKRCGCPPSHAKLLVKIMVDLRHKRSKSNIFLGKDSFITPRDLLRWAERQSGSKHDLAEHGYMILAERLRSEEEKKLVLDVLEEHIKVTIDLERLYYGKNSEAKQLLDKSLPAAQLQSNHLIASIAPTRSMLRLIHLVSNCVRQREPVLLVGETGCGKTTVIQLLSFVLNQTLYAVNCHATTETSDLIGGLRPVRGRDAIKEKIAMKLIDLIQKWPYDDMLNDLNLHEYTSMSNSGKWDLKLYDVETMVALAKTISSRRPEIIDDKFTNERTKKKRKTEKLFSPSKSNSVLSGNEIEALDMIAVEIEELGRHFRALFEWSDGPLVKAMKSGQLLLLDEISLAEDAVLERLNSVLEPSRLLVLAEKGDDGSSVIGKDDRIIVAHDQFRIFATMNPGGDFGKRELSPALRSRFTEIWVPSIKERSDFEIVLERSMAPLPSLSQKINLQQASVIGCILDYVEFFNADICGVSSSPYAGYSLSLRDIISWAHFIVETRKSNASLAIWDALYHGACLMHLDGIGLGSGLDSDASTNLKLEAEQYLLSLVPDGSISNVRSVDDSFCIHNGQFGVFPYFINVGKVIIPNSTFNMKAPTTSLNAFRILRAMQLKKPILLEGSPGVGKTSLISALASASGNKLVRINLSEQTDVSDLMGSDIPIENSENSGPSFEWCDGVLLTAIKEGSWVLLDELNLASQAVLEGLNSCLDHRATTYIPELGKSFVSPPTFRVFAAQNPLGQGGGRKGLPKSFLNRFTKVFIDALTDSDLRSILSSRFHSFSEDFVNQVINFNNHIYREVVELREYGTDGGPWEFNLRDVFRWCELIESGRSSHIAGARDLYYQRFRTQGDRDKMDQTFKKYFGCSVVPKYPPKFKVLDNTVQIGEAFLNRLDHLGETLQTRTTIRESDLLFSRLTQMEAVARCINLRWPCLLVGGSGSGKTTIISNLAGLCNATLIEHCLSPSSDVSELIGGFEQREAMSNEIQIIKDVCILANNILIADAFQSRKCKWCWDVTTKLDRYIDNWNNSNTSFEEQMKLPWEQVTKLSEMLSCMVKENLALSDFETRVNFIDETVRAQTSENKSVQKQHKSGQFVWRDGILVEALLKGYWLLLENVNLCQSSVLDRLNSVTERDGFLLLSESGTQEGENNSHAHRIIKPHENFRIFFTMNAINGEVSRAMRNRCVEISLLDYTMQNLLQPSRKFPNISGHDLPIISSIFPKTQIVDFLSIMRSARIRSMELASAIMQTYANERLKSSTTFEDPPCLRSVLVSLRMFSGLLSRGLDPGVLEQEFIQIVFEVEESTIVNKFASTIFDRIPKQEATPLPANLLLNSVGSEASLINTLWEARLLRVFSGKQSNVQDAMSALGLFNVSKLDPKSYQEEFNASAFPSFHELQCFLSQLFVRTYSLEDLQMRVSVLFGLKNPMAYTIRWMSSVLKDSLNQTAHSMAHSSITDCSSLVWSHLQQRFIENVWIRNLAKRDTVLDSLKNLMVLEASYYIHENVLDESVVPCSVTRLLYPLFLSIDNWVASIVNINDDTDLVEFLPTLRLVLDERDKLWTLLKDLPLNLTVMNGFSAFNESEFIVQWQWLRKVMPKSELQIPSIKGWQKIILWIDAIDRAIFGGPRPTWSAHNIRKKMNKPIVPRRSRHWEAFFLLEDLSHGCSLVTDHRFDPFMQNSNPIDLQQLMRIGHPSLYITDEEKMQLLAAICTSQLTWYSYKANETTWIDEIDFPKKMKEVFDKLRGSFEIEITSAKVDLEIQTIDVQVEAKVLDDLRDLSTTTISKMNSYSLLKTRLLDFFGKVQISVLAEFWCVHQEIAICGELSKLLLDSSGDEKSIRKELLRLKPGIKSLVDNVTFKTIWTVSDMRSFQTIIWALEEKSPENLSLNNLLRSLIPTILSTLSRHSFTGSFICTNSISSSLEMPDTWTSEEIESDSLFNDDVSDNNGRIFGNARLRQSVRTEIMLRMIGEQLSFSKEHTPIKFYTIENALHRKSQSKEILSMLSNFSISPSKARLYTYHYILFDILTAVKEVFQDCTMDAFLLFAKNPHSLTTSSMDEIVSAGENVQNNFFGLFWNELLFPLLKSLYLAWKEDSISLEYGEQCSRASIYLGLLRLNLLTPCTPLDPGRAPFAKVSLITRQLTNIKSRLTSVRLHSGFVQGDFDPETIVTKSLLERADHLSRKQKSQQKKVIERIESAPAFIELYRETRDFLTTSSNSAVVLELVEATHAVNTKGNGGGSTERRAENWQRNAAAFCRRLSTDFGAYEDVITSIIDSVRMIQDGLFDLMHNKLGAVGDIGIYCKDLIRELYQYPMSEGSDCIRFLFGATGMGEAKVRLPELGSKSECFKTLSIAILARLFLKKELVGLEEDEFWTCSRLFTRITNSCSVFVSVKEDSSLKEMEEQAFREQFPDHRKEFDGILRDTTGEIDGEDVPVEAKEDNLNSIAKDKPLSDIQIELLYQIYNGIFCGKKSACISSIRKMAFHSSYAAAYELHKNFGNAGNCSHRSDRMGGHVFAMCLSSIPNVTMGRVHSYFRETSNVTDFQNEACPAMALSAAGPLEQLIARTTQLLTAFPGHSILIGLGKICEKVNKLNVMTTPIGKVMTGLEIILKQAQDWEQHASEKVRLGSPLTDIGRLIFEWRKFELESWGKLIQGRQNRHVNKTKKYWIRLHGILANDAVSIRDIDQVIGNKTFVANKTRCITPQWVWKGSTIPRSKLCDTLDNIRLQDLKDLVKALDTFMLTSPLGEFEERLKILKACADESSTINLKVVDVQSSWRLQQSRTLYSIWMYYKQYLSVLASKLLDLRAPIEAKLKNETKLAKWDNQSYYALAESTERNQRKLMKILSEFDESLNLNVGILIQEENCLGLRSNVNANDEFCATFPSFSSMFPIQGIAEEIEPMIDLKTRYCCDLVNVDEKKITAPAEGHIWKILKYAHKMKILRTKSSKKLINSYVRVGEDAASYFCRAIFGRIESLRENGSRPMKERALVDLFRELKENGFSTTQWSAPKELKDIEQLFLLPTPRLGTRGIEDFADGTLMKAEQYYMKCLVEVHALRSETMILGSRYMSRREVDLMVNLSYSGIHMLTQQRCFLSNLLTENHDLQECILSMQISKLSLPTCQSDLKRLLKVFREKCILAFESVQQLSLLLQSTKPLINGESENNWARDVISKLESLYSEPSGERLEHICFVTWEMLQEMEEDRKQLVKASGLIRACRSECKDLSCLPLDTFDVCLDSIEHALSSESECIMVSNKSKEKNTELFSSKCSEFSEKLSSIIEQVLVTYQRLSKEANSTDQSETNPLAMLGVQPDSDVAIWDCHKKFLKSYSTVELKLLNQNLFDLIEHLCGLYDDQSVPNDQRECCVGLVSNTRVLIVYLHQLSQSMLQDYIHFYFSTAKLNYIILRLFRSLVAKGYCADKTAEGDAEDESDIKGMAFDDDLDGTGMGEGDGKKDVTDQIENEDQLAGLKSDKDNDDDQNKPDDSKQLNEEEADKGMEMEADFDGEMYDLPDNPEDKNEMEDQEGEELDQEMGEGANDDDEVVDEKMWNDSDDEDEINKDEEKFEQDSGVEGQAIEDATRTKEDVEEGKKPDGDDNPPNEDLRGENPNDVPGEVEEQDDDHGINDDTEDRYEDQHDVDVRGDENEEAQEEPDQLDDQMHLDDNLQLDDKDQEDDADNTGDEGTGEIAENDSLSDGTDSNDDCLEDEHNSGDEDEKAENETAANQTESAMDLDHEEKGDPEKDDDTKDEAHLDKSSEDPVVEEAHGIRSTDGTDIVKEDDDEEEDQEGATDDPNDVVGNPFGGKSDGDQADTDGNDGGGYNDQINETNTDTNSKESPLDIPNPLKDPGDASKFWHKKLNIIGSNESANEPNTEENKVDDADISQNQKSGDFEYSADQDSTQVLGEATNEEAVELDLVDNDEEDKVEEARKIPKDNETENKEQNKTDKTPSRQKNPNPSLDQKEQNDIDDGLNEDGSFMDEIYKEETDDEDMAVEEEESDDLITGTHVVSDLSKLQVDENKFKAEINPGLVQDEYVANVTAAEADEAHSQWLRIQGETQSLSRRLCEKLRLVMEPLVASKLRGDYRTGKRINMKRVIGYIASGYRKDKIWLRRTKPAKRNYRVLLAVDDSESMKKSGAGEMALHAMATVAVGMNQLEVGELGVASFGDDMKLVHPFHMPFTSESGVSVIRNFKFEQQRTRIAMCVESAMAALEDSGDRSSMQLVFLISDGRIERDSRSALKRLIREMVERNMLLAMIIVEGKQKKKDSILNMKEVTFEKGKPVVKRFIDDYPFPYYIVLDDVVSLPEILGDALKQWFEMLTQLQSSS